VDGAAAEDILRRQPHQYLPEDDRVWQVVQDSQAIAVRHGRDVVMMGKIINSLVV
jgi:hypothetical protein